MPYKFSDDTAEVRATERANRMVERRVDEK
jgi:hypothetical protein